MRPLQRACLLVTALSACGPGPAPRVNLLLVSFDTLRADRLGAYGNDEWGRSPSPAIDALAAGGALFETAYAPRGQTHPSLAAMLTGKYPITTTLRENGHPLPPEHETLMEQLRDAGYRTGVFVANIPVGHAKQGWVARGADEAADGYAGRRDIEAQNESIHQRVWDDRVEAAAGAFLDETGDEPFAMWLHFYDVHKPYTPPQPWRDAYGLSPGLPPVLAAPPEGEDHFRLEEFLARITLGMRDASEAELRRIRGLYDGGISATDERLARVLGRLEDLGVQERTLIVFTSDHGEELHDRNEYFFHGSSIHEGTLRVPLVVAGPGVAAGTRIPDVVRIVDIAPTVLDLLDLPPVAEHEGRSLLPLLRGEGLSVVPAVLEWQDFIYAATDGHRKLVWNPEHVWPRKEPYHLGPPDAGYRIDCVEAYDLRADPGEQVNLLPATGLAAVDLATGAGLPPELAPLYDAIRRFLTDPRHHQPFPGDANDQVDVEHLANIGYVASTADRSDSVRKEPCGDR